MKVPSISNSKYLITFIDDLSHMTFLYFLKQKSEAFEKFKEFKKFVENQTRRHIKVLRSDNCGEYTSTEFKKFCQDEGIARQFTVPYTPQHNGVAERRNQTLMEATRCMMA